MSSSSTSTPSGSDATEDPGEDTQGKTRAGSRRGKSGCQSPRGGDLKSDKAGSVGSAAGTTGNGATAREIPDGSDDDIVARRLRKAAEQETDPELKDKLWKEYIDYKKNAPGK